jgi:hypothetical protein
MLDRSLVKVGFLFLVALLPLASAELALAHSHEDYWSDTWPNGDVLYNMTVSIPSGLGSDKHDAIASGGSGWNAQSTRITFKRSGNEVADFDWDGLACDRPNAIHWVPISGANARSIVCQDFFLVRLDRFQIAFDSQPTSPEAWYWGIQGNQGLNDNFVTGVSAHEFGHAAGGWQEEPGDIGHFDATNNPNLCGGGVPLADLQTMCSSVDERFEGTEAKASLEFHDIDTFQHWYP